ncbi:MAG: MFS transporter [Gammaproteobacteria bacterium]|nr:MFS transporter [Gammaproteobacteria bacterium]
MGPPRPGALIATVCLVEALGMAAFATFPTLIPVFQEDWNLNSTEAGWISGVYFAGYVAAVAVLTSLTDRIDAKKVYLWSMALSALSALGFALFASGLWSASLWRMLQGIGLAGTYMPGLKALSDALPERLQSRATAFYTSSFGVGASLSYYLSGLLSETLDWQWTFGLLALGPAVAFLLALRVFDSRPPERAGPTTRLLDFRPVIKNRRALGYTLAYTVHNAELFAFRSWIVAFLVFSQSHQSAGAVGAGMSAATIAALLNLLGMPSSVLTNEVAARLGRQRTIIAVMLLSAVVGTLFGFSSTMVFWLVLALAVVHAITITADSATITAGVVKAADPVYKGTTMAMHSVVGFVGAILGPMLFGLVLDLAGGAQQPAAWGYAFGSMALVLLLGPVAVARFVGMQPRMY